jgi:hypothetical protein
MKSSAAPKKFWIMPRRYCNNYDAPGVVYFLDIDGMVL